MPKAPAAVFSTTAIRADATSTRPVADPVPYSSLTVGVPKEIFPNERRVAITPQNVALLLKKGFSRVLVERGAGAEASFGDNDYAKAGATIVGSAAEVWRDSNIVLKVRPPTGDKSPSEADQLREGATIISFLYPPKNMEAVEKMMKRRGNSFAMEQIPRISRAQVFDALR